MIQSTLERIELVLAAHAGSIKVLHTLYPIGVGMADARDYNIYKD